MNSESSVPNQYELCCNSSLASSDYQEYFGNTYDSNEVYQNQFESEELTQSSNDSNSLFNMSSNNNAMVYETVTQHTRIHIPTYTSMRGLELYDMKQQSPCYYQDNSYSNCKYEPMVDYAMSDKLAPNQSYLGFNSLPYQDFPRQSPQHIHNNMFLEYCDSPVQSSSSDDDNNNNNNALSDQTHPFLSGEQPYTCPDTRAVCHVPQKRRGKQLWKFLYQLLQDDSYNKVICWSENGKSQFEFKLLEPEEVATLWGKEKGKPNMNYDKLSRSLRFYYQKNLIQKVSGDHYVYRFPINPENLIKYIDTQSKRPKGGRAIRNSIESQCIQQYQISPYTQAYNGNYSCYEQTPGASGQYYDLMSLPLSHDDAQTMQMTYPSS